MSPVLRPLSYGKLGAGQAKHDLEGGWVHPPAQTHQDPEPQEDGIIGRAVAVMAAVASRKKPRGTPMSVRNSKKLDCESDVCVALYTIGDGADGLDDEATFGGEAEAKGSRVDEPRA